MNLLFKKFTVEADKTPCINYTIILVQIIHTLSIS